MMNILNIFDKSQGISVHFGEKYSKWFCQEGGKKFSLGKFRVTKVIF